MKNTLLTFLAILISFFILLTFWDGQKGDYLAERDLWFMTKDFQQICANMPGLSENTLTYFIERCQNFLSIYPHTGVTQQAKKLMDNAITLKKAMEIPN